MKDRQKLTEEISLYQLKLFQNILEILPRTKKNQ